MPAASGIKMCITMSTVSAMARRLPLPLHRDVYWQTVARIKAALDPDGISAPGRYQPGWIG